MNNFPFDVMNLEAGEVQALEDTYKALKAKFNISAVTTSATINKFELFNNEQQATIAGSFLINNPASDSYLTFVKIRYKFSTGRTNLDYLKCQVWAFVNLKQDFGRVLIRKETFADRMLELIHPIELKFKDDKLFNSNFYVVANDKEKATAAITPAFRSVIIDMMYKDFVIEIINSTLVVRNSQPINPADAVHLAELATKIAAVS